MGSGAMDLGRLLALSHMHMPIGHAHKAHARTPVWSRLPAAAARNRPWDFNGCGGNGVMDLHTIEFRNDGWADAWACVDRVKLV